MSKSDSKGLVTIILGAGGVGKSALTLRLMYDEFVEEYEPTKSDAYTKPFIVSGQETPVSIIDTAGQEDYNMQDDQNIRTSNGFFFIFSIIDSYSFDAIDAVYEKILRVKNTNEIIGVLVGNKMDMVLPDGSNRAVQRADAEAKAAKFKIKYMETSAKTKEGVKEMFYYVLEELVKKSPTVNIENAVASKGKKKFKCNLL